MPYCIYSKDKKPLQVYDFYEDAASAVFDIEGAYIVEITDEEAEYIENDISDYKYFKNTYGDDEDDLDFERSWGPKDDEEEGPEYNEAHAKEWMEKHPHGYYNNEEDYGYEDGEETINVKEDLDSNTSKYIVKINFDDEDSVVETFNTEEEAIEYLHDQYDNWYFDDIDIAEDIIFPLLCAAENHDWEETEEGNIIECLNKKSLKESDNSDAEPTWLVQYYEGQGTDEHIKGFDAFYAYVDIAEEGIKIQNIWPDTGNEEFDSKLPCWTEEEELLDNDDHDYYDDFYSDFANIKEGIETSTKPFKNPIVIDLTDNGNVGQIRIEAEDEALAREVDALATEAYENSLDDFDAKDLAGYEYFDKIATEKGLNFEPVFDDDIDDEYIDQIKNKSLKEYYNEEDDYPRETFTPEEQEEYGIDEEGIDEAGEQWIHCAWCGDVVPISDCRRELNLGWICDTCQNALSSRGERAAYYEAKDIKKFTKAEKELNEGIIFSDKAIRCQVKDLLNDPLGKLILSRLQAGRVGNGPYRLSDEELEILKDEYIYYEDDGDCYYARFEKPTNEIRKILNLSPQSDNPFIADKESYTEDLNKNKLPKIGDTIRIIHLKDEDNRYDGRVGEVESIDDIGQLHGTWGGLAVIPEEDEFEIVTTANESLEESNQLNEDARYVGDYRGFSIYKEVGGGYWAQKGYSDDVFDEEFESKADIKKAIDDLINSSGRRGLYDRFGESLTEDTDDDWADLDDWVDFP